jgi:NSS family neurotransmitter:Na+ symporter
VALIIQRLGWSRPWAALAVAFACFAAGIATVGSFNWWAGWHPFQAFAGFEQATFYDLLDYLTSNVLLPLVGFVLALFAGWVVPGRLLTDELSLSPAGAAILRVLLRYVAPAGIAAVALAPFFA